MKVVTQGIHHITAIARDPQKTVDFYTQILGLRLVKKSVNQDDVKTYHFFFGDRTGDPGMDLTFFTFQPIMQGQRGVGQVTTISLAVPQSSLGFWSDRFKEKEVVQESLSTRFGKERLIFYDHDQQRLELVGVPDNELNTQKVQLWTTAEISELQAIRHFYSAQLSCAHISLLEPVLSSALGYKLVEKENTTSLFKIGEGNRAVYLEVEEDPALEHGMNAAGTVHHIAFQVADEQELLKAREQVINSGLYPTEVINRYYFKSVYFRTRAGILFELATNGPGFTIDEEEKDLGTKLALPPFLETYRTEIEAGLTPIV